MNNFNLTTEEKNHLRELNDYCETYWDILDYFQEIRPKEYDVLLSRIAKSYGMQDINDTNEWDVLSYDGTADDIVLDAKNEILERSGILCND